MNKKSYFKVLTDPEPPLKNRAVPPFFFNKT
jgi:hypothetical protein